LQNKIYLTKLIRVNEILNIFSKLYGVYQQNRIYQMAFLLGVLQGVHLFVRYRCRKDSVIECNVLLSDDLPLIFKTGTFFWVWCHA